MKFQIFRQFPANNLPKKLEENIVDRRKLRLLVNQFIRLINAPDKNFGTFNQKYTIWPLKNSHLQFLNVEKHGEIFFRQPNCDIW